MSEISKPININNECKPVTNTAKSHSSSWSIYGSSPGGSIYNSNSPYEYNINVAKCYCNNCGNYDHYFRQCKEPITSMGIIAYRTLPNDKREYLMIRRKNTLGFIEFVLGHYYANDPESIIILFKQMIQTEIDFIGEHKDDFDAIWNYLWNNNPIATYAKFKKEKEHSRFKFKLLNCPTHILTIDYCVGNIKPIWNRPEWGFPKGRRNMKETNLESAIREFEEETSYSMDELIVHDKDELIEIFNGTNGVLYRHIYFVAECFSLKEPSLSESNKHQMNEIGDIKWFSYEEALDHIREYHTQKKEVLKLVDSEY